MNDPKIAFTCYIICAKWWYASSGYILQCVISLSILFKIKILGNFYVYNCCNTLNVWLETPSTTSTTNKAESVNLSAEETSE
jgi:hypothetical protein